jgi:hypothetical protein
MATIDPISWACNIEWFVAVIEALRINPDRYTIIYNNKHDNNENVFNNNNNNNGTVEAVSYSHFSLS